MKQVIFSILLSGVALCCNAQMRPNEAYRNYFDKYCELAVEQMKHYHIPASITLAQGVFESAAGKSELARKGNNHFGIKCHGWTGRKTYHDDDEKGECFRAYDTVRESFEDHSLFLCESKRYAPLFELSITDYKGWAHGLKACGYATNPSYATKLIEIIELYKLNRYDRVNHRVSICNKVAYVIAWQGDTYESISKEFGISAKKLLKYNERSGDNMVLEEDDRVYLNTKRNSADVAFKNRPHVVENGESMYSIAQNYGIKIKKLYKKNKLNPDYSIKVGDKLRVY